MLKAHIKRVHESVNQKCDLCPYEGKNLYNHKTVHSGNKIQCPSCSLEFKTKKGLTVHVKFQHTNSFTIHKCDFCEKTSKDKKSIRIHMDKDHLGIRHICTECNETFKTKLILKKHKNRFHNINRKTYSCEFCSYSTFAQESMRTHKLFIHLGKKYPCDLCSYNATKKSSLKEHKRRLHLKVHN